VLREAPAGRGGGQKNKEDKRGRQARRRWRKLGRGGGEKRKGDAPRVSKVSNEIQV